MIRDKGKLLLILTGFMVLVFDAKTALEAASSGIQLCLYTIIPSLFPFVFLSSILVNELCGHHNILMDKIGSLLRMPPGSEGFLIAGFLGGYPAGAACIAESYCSGLLRKEQAERLLCFCNNAGPAFIFGIAGSIFSPGIPWILWGIHILSAIFTGIMMPVNDRTPIQSRKNGQFSATAALGHTTKVMVSVCGWVILFRILISFCDRWFLWLFPDMVQVLFSGILEMSNGCLALESIPLQSLRFILVSLFLAFGGLCVTMQTASAVAPLSIRFYTLGKLMQSAISVLLSILLCPLLFAENTVNFINLLLLFPAPLLVCIIAYYFNKKTVAFPAKMIYNG